MRRTGLAMVAAGLMLNALASASGPVSDPKSFRELHSLIKPKPTEEVWTRIPWMTSLWEARQRAATEGKPILLWEMDGHPLGCT